eukprot:CAMPEP_0113549816 /NCGR_PEP_ID=MMETSP0015_2-20120614/13645_1 /TAXON_ID=2838 /ORGANISM="Odontella" /LENGTH=314 /DNA_ID=CAMNT_0000450571 /DNA_START=379 /DNA_END=1323 /DNA_ORIENTATION=+ /assembly_acc=CAM_ASM_000160
MAAVTSRQHQLTSTLEYDENKDFSTAVAAKHNPTYGQEYHEEQLKFLLSAFQAMSSERQETLDVVEREKVTARAVEMDLADAATAEQDAESFDKILILVRPGESTYSVFEQEWADAGNDPDGAVLSDDYPRDGLLTGKGCGQVLDIARRTAVFCNDETGLVPELVVVSPLKRAVQTALLSFPSLSPGCVHDTPWVCHGSLMERAGLKADFVSPADELEAIFPGIDYSQYREIINPEVVNSLEGRNIVESKKELLQRTDEFLGWIKAREERVIVVASHSTWFQSFCGFTLRNEPEGHGSEMFGEGEMRALAIKFD